MINKATAVLADEFPEVSFLKRPFCPPLYA
jgi:hypothetical protein